MPYWKQRFKWKLMSSTVAIHRSQKTSSQHERTREKLVDFSEETTQPKWKDCSLVRALLSLKLKQMAGSRTGFGPPKSPGYPFWTFCMSSGELTTNILACPWESSYSRFSTGFEREKVKENSIWMLKKNVQSMIAIWIIPIWRNRKKLKDEYY